MRILFLKLLSYATRHSLLLHVRPAHYSSYSSQMPDYKQGYSPGRKLREYFYFVDHQGQLFLDDTRMKNFVTAFKDKKFLSFFFRRVKINTTSRWRDYFPYISPCGPELNYIRCDDLPIVFTTLLCNDTASSRYSLVNLTETHDMSLPHYFLSYGGARELLLCPFQPSSLCMHPVSGRVYHAGPDGSGGIGLIKSSLADELSALFHYENRDATTLAPTHFMLNMDKLIPLKQELLALLEQFSMLNYKLSIA